MFRTILVPASGSDTDAVVFETALAAARPQRAHLEFFHVCVSAGEALRYMPHASFARGDGLHNVLQELKQESEHRSDAAQRHVRDFCKRHKIAMLDMPGRFPALSASWRTEAENGEDPFITRARVHDLVVMRRFTRPNGLPPTASFGRMRSADHDCRFNGAARISYGHGRVEGRARGCTRHYRGDA